MSELFPEAFQVQGNESFEVQNISWFSYGDVYQSTAEQDSAIEHAVMNHDRLEQENAELRKAASSLLDLFDGVVFTHNTHQGRTDFLNARNNLKQLLNK